MSAVNTRKQRKNTSKDKKVDQEVPSFKVDDLIVHIDNNDDLTPEKVVFILPSGDIICIGTEDNQERILSRYQFKYYKIYTPPPPKGKLFIPIYRRSHKTAAQAPYFCGSSRDSIEEVIAQGKFLSFEYTLVAIKELEFTEGEGLDLLK